jgi:outer membrane protein assembly factor BamB
MLRSLTFRLSLGITLVTALAGADWPQFRGPDSHGASADDRAPPFTFGSNSAADKPGTGKNIAWRVDLPGRGVSGPIAIRGRVIVTAASGNRENRLHVLCFDAASGNPLWERQFWATGRTLCHPTSSVAAPTPASDGQHVYAFFSSNDLVCLDLDGNLKWYRGLTLDFPTAANDVGMSSSPLVHGGLVFVQVENKGKSFAAAIDAATGETRWQIDRLAEMNWTSPAILRGATPDADVLLLQSTDKLTAHVPATGKLLWTYNKTCAGIPSVVGSGGTVFVPSEGLTALKHPPEASSAEVIWNSNKLDTGNGSPVVHDGRIYVINKAGALSCANAADGEILWRLRLKGPFWASPVLAAGHLYLVNHDGVAQVVKLGAEQGEIVGTSELGEKVLGTPAVADGALYVRSDAHLWKIAQP